MKFYVVFEHWYNYCDQWDVAESYWLSEEKAIERVIELESKTKISENYWVDYESIQTED